jgi:serine/threonine protein kinase
MPKYCTKCSKEYADSHVVCPVDGTPLIAPGDRDLSGEEIDGRYLVKRVLGQGGMGTVYVAEQTMIGRDVGLKVLRRDLVQDTTSIKRFQTEAKAIARLRNPHTVTIYDFGVTPDGLLYYTMELLEGFPLSSLLKKTGPVALERAVDITMQALESLEEAHDHQILHRDLKPDNLFVSDHKGKDHVTILDFGIAKLVGDQSVETVTRTGMICGTPQYLSPEQALGNKATAASDLYSLGIVFYEMLAGQPPFRAETPMKVLLKHLNESPMPLSQLNPLVSVPAAIHQFITRSLAKHPEERFASVGEFRAALQAAVAGGGKTTPLPVLNTDASGTRTMTPPDAGDVDPTGETAMVPTPASVASLPSEAHPARAEAIAAAPAVSRKGLMLGATGAGIVLALMLAIWQPWNGSPASEKAAEPGADAPAAVRQPAPAQAPASAPTEAALEDVLAAPSPDVISDPPDLVAQQAVDVAVAEAGTRLVPDLTPLALAGDAASAHAPDLSASDSGTAPDAGARSDMATKPDIAPPAPEAPEPPTQAARSSRAARKPRGKETTQAPAKPSPQKAEPSSGGLTFRGLDDGNAAPEKDKLEEPKRGGGLKFRALDGPE